MWTVSHIVTFSWSGKKSGRKTKRVLCDDDGEAVLFAIQVVVWSQDRPARGVLKRYDGWRVERVTANGRELVREGTKTDAEKEYREEDLAKAPFGTVAASDVYGSKRGRTASTRTSGGRRGKPSRLTAFAAQVLKDK